jgi:hypothetical protein
LILQVLQFVDIIAHVADRGHAAGDVEHAVESLRVSVHVEQAGQERLAGAVDALGVSRHLNGTCGTGSCEMIAGHDDRLIFAHNGLLGVEQAHMFNRDRVRGMPR